MGIPGSGKSEYIKRNYSDAKIIDLYDFQKDNCCTINEIFKSYEDCLDALKNACMQDKDIVLEHTMLKAIRRKPYIDAVKEAGLQLDIILILPDLKIIEERKKKRGIFVSTEMIEEELDLLEKPTAEEGFDYIEIAKS